MNKKFSFNFKFLDRFKKNKTNPEAQLETQPETLVEEEIEILDEHQELNHEIDDQQEDFDPTTDPQHVIKENAANENEPAEDYDKDYDDDKTDPAIITNTAHLNPHNSKEEIVNLDDLVKLHREKIESGEEIETSSDDHESDPDQFVELKGVKKIDELLDEAKVKHSFKFFSFKDKFSKFKKSKDETIESESKGINFSGFEWSQIVLKIFSPYNRHRVHALFIIAMAGTLTYLIGKNGALLFSSSTSKTARTSSGAQDINVVNTTPRDITVVADVNLFNARSTEGELQKGPDINIENIVCDEGEKPTELPLKLMDTVVLQDSVKSVAAVQVRGRSELLNIREGEKLEEMAEVSKINRLNVVIKNLETGTCEYIGNNDDETSPSPIKYVSSAKGKALLKANNPEIKSNGNNFKITKNYRNKMLANINQILTEAKAVPITNPDGSLSFKMTEIVPGSLYSQLNIQENDIITQINGKKIENMNEIMSQLGRIKEIDNFQLTVRRNGMTENLEYNFE